MFDTSMSSLSELLAKSPEVKCLTVGVEHSSGVVTGCNMAFAPVVDILYNHECEEVLSRSFGNDPERVAAMGKAYMDGLHKTEGVAATAEHFPGNGQDYRDAHISNNINSFNHDKWMATYGHVYKTLIDGGLDAIMGGHILMPELMRDVKPGITYEEMLPATLCKEIMTDLLRDELGFNGMVVTDASHMVGMTNQMTRREMLPLSINAGCDMFLFFNDPDEDYGTMLDAYKNGIISEERMVEALTRILGLKAKMGLNKKAKEELCPSGEELQSVLHNPSFAEYAPKISRDAVTLVKNLDKNVLPLSPEKTKRIMIVPIKGVDNPLMALAAMAMGGGMARKTPAEKLKERLEAKGFEVFIYESPIDKIKAMMARGEKPSLNIYFAGKHSIADFVAQQDLVISLFDVMNGHPSFGLSKGGGEIPWYVHELPVVGPSFSRQSVTLKEFPTIVLMFLNQLKSFAKKTWNLLPMQRRSLMPSALPYQISLLFPTMHLFTMILKLHIRSSLLRRLSMSFVTSSETVTSVA